MRRTGAALPASLAAITLRRKVLAAVMLTSSRYRRKMMISPLLLMRKMAESIFVLWRESGEARRGARL